MDHKPISGVSVHRSQSQMVTVKAMTITVDSLLPRLKLDCDVGYGTTVKGASVVVEGRREAKACQMLQVPHMGSSYLNVPNQAIGEATRRASTKATG